MHADKLPTLEQVQEFVIAGHGNLAKVQQLLAEHPQLLNMSYEWRPNDTETALQAAAHVGNRPIAEYLLAQGAPLDICTAAMLGNEEKVAQFLAENPAQIHATGAHGISLMAHAALSGKVSLTQSLWQAGVNTGMSMALSLAVSKGDVEMTQWLLANGDPDITWQNFSGKTALDIANERSDTEIISLLEAHLAKQ